MIQIERHVMLAGEIPDFQRFMDELESLARRQKKPVRIVCFMNDRLYHHILKRAGWRVCVFAKDALEYGGCNED